MRTVLLGGVVVPACEVPGCPERLGHCEKHEVLRPHRKPVAWAFDWKPGPTRDTCMCGCGYDTCRYVSPRGTFEHEGKLRHNSAAVRSLLNLAARLAWREPTAADPRAPHPVPEGHREDRKSDEDRRQRAIAKANEIAERKRRQQMVYERNVQLGLSR